MATATLASQFFRFGQHQCRKTQLFFSSKLSYGFVNYKPVVPYHVLVIPKRHVLRYEQLTIEEVTDMMVSSQTIGAALEKHTGTTSLTFVIQDGKESGQTVEHVHVHIMPRRAGDFKRNDQIYDEIERVDAESRRARTEKEMADEASELAKLFPDNQVDEL